MQLVPYERFVLCATSQSTPKTSHGNKGRVVLFPKCLAEPIERQLVFAKALAAQDHAQGIPVALPGLLAKKYPSAARSERWAWLFPSRTTCRHPRTGIQVRWRCHENNVQRAVKEAARRCHLEGLTGFGFPLAALSRRRTRRASRLSQRGGSGFGIRVSDLTHPAAARFVA